MCISKSRYVYSSGSREREYELNDHLGNVRYRFSDLKRTTGGAGHAPFKADMLGYDNYYPFGMMPEDRRATALTGGIGRYGYNGKEMDNEFNDRNGAGDGTANSYDYGFRMYEPRLGKFLSEDPLTGSYPELTPYQYAGNDVIRNTDLDGAEPLDAIKKIAEWFNDTFGVSPEPVTEEEQRRESVEDNPTVGGPNRFARESRSIPVLLASTAINTGSFRISVGATGRVNHAGYTEGLTLVIPFNLDSRRFALLHTQSGSAAATRFALNANASAGISFRPYEFASDLNGTSYSGTVTVQTPWRFVNATGTASYGSSDQPLGGIAVGLQYGISGENVLGLIGVKGFGVSVAETHTTVLLGSERPVSANGDDDVISNSSAVKLNSVKQDKNVWKGPRGVHIGGGVVFSATY